ncbi:MAG: DnaJ domain-containing protein [Deltaproteobacteria bacterium]|nr:DnaJ domain-containing protein [Deltaproteobacteria bacterium]
MSPEPFIDLYELLQVSPNANREVVERVFRHLAKLYHPDNPHTGDSKRFQEILRAYRILMDPEKRATYDVYHQQHMQAGWEAAREAKDTGSLSDVREIRNRILSLLYAQRRREPRQPGLGDMQIAQLIGVPDIVLEFHLWYLRQKGFIDREEEGTLSITVDGIDACEELDGRALRPDRLLTKREHPDDDDPHSR